MSGIYIIADSILSPLGINTDENFVRILKGESGLKSISRSNFDFDVYASYFETGALEGILDDPFFATLTRFEKLLYYPIRNVLEDSQIDPRSSRTLFVIATTKGNIELLEEGIRDQKSLSLYNSACKISSHFQNPNKPIVVSNACISGISAQIIACGLIDSGRFDTVIVVGADTVNAFVLEGFNALKALSPGHCKPFDRDRDGINLGEAGAAMVISNQSQTNKGFKVTSIIGGAITNDANHISGPSRTGLEMSMAIDQTLKQAGIVSSDIDFISAHGTGTVFNDEMESKALNNSKLDKSHIHSLKAYFGHTLGCAGLLESIIAVNCLQNEVFIGSRGYSNPGTSFELNISSEHIRKPFKNCIKTMAGFGGCNAAIGFSKS